MQDLMEKYRSLIEYLKLDFLKETLYLSDNTNDYDRLKKYVEEIFDIETSETQFKRFSWIKRYIISEESKRWDILVGTASLLFAHNMQTYLDGNDHHVLYRVTPYFVGNELLARGVEMEAYSVEDSGRDLCFHVFVYNIQPGIEIDYETGENEAAS